MNKNITILFSFRIKNEVIVSSFCMLYIVQVLLDAATTDPIFKSTTSTSAQFALKHKTDSVIRDVSIIEHLVLDWQIWERCHPGIPLCYVPN